MTFQQLRADLDLRGFGPETIALPGDPPTGPMLEGALHVIARDNG
ncbi:hypothetical protein [Curtobacterium sp. 'Ferrero']|nr:hypothetical protein [Curtobacterium sp. 'Ferrero']